MSTLSYALVGCGRIAHRHIIAYQACKDLKLVGLVDTELEAAQSLAHDHGLDCTTFASLDDLLATEVPDIVAIATESGSHAPLALKALLAGSHVIIEKPMALSIEECNKIIETAKSCNKKLSVCHQNRYNQSMQYVAQMMQEGALSELTHAACTLRWNRNKPYYEQASWRGTWAHDGGCVMNQCIHILDALLYLVDRPVKSVWAKTTNIMHPYIEGEDLALATITFDGGLMAHFEGTVDIYEKNLEETLSLFGKGGLVKIGGTSLNMIEELRCDDPNIDLETIKAQTHEMPQNVYGFGHSALYQEFTSAIQNDGCPLIDAHAGARAVELVLAIYESSRTGCEVKLPLKSASSMDMKGFEPWK